MALHHFRLEKPATSEPINGKRLSGSGLVLGDGAIRAAAEYGKTVGHAADLHFGDCLTYACAKAYRLKLIYKGDGFAKTDLA